MALTHTHTHTKNHEIDRKLYVDMFEMRVKWMNRRVGRKAGHQVARADGPEWRTAARHGKAIK